MELFNCANLSPDQEHQLAGVYESGGWQGPCESPERPRSTQPCRRVIMAWAMGAHTFEYPPEVGQSIGGEGYSPFVVLEVHYNNPRHESGLRDSSGLRFDYTTRLRRFDAGILEVGLEYTAKNSIPPGLVAPIAGYCVAECTRLALSETRNVLGGHLDSQLLKHDLHEKVQYNEQEDDDQSSSSSVNPSKDGGIFVFAGQLHTHLTGVASWTEHIRGGKLIGELQRDNHYSPHFQDIRLLPRARYVAPGDSLIHYCLYDTRQRFNMTLGGFSTRDEMCVTYLHYYPRVDLEVCKSSIDSAALERYFSYLASQEGQQTSSRRQRLYEPLANQARARSSHNNDTRSTSTTRTIAKTTSNGLLDNGQAVVARTKSIGENYLAIQWSRRRSLELLQFYSQAPLSVQCNRSDGSRLPGNWLGLEPTRRTMDQLDWLMPGASDRKPPPLDSFLSYRGSGFGLRHAQCARSQPDREPVARYPPLDWPVIE